MLKGEPFTGRGPGKASPFVVRVDDRLVDDEPISERDSATSGYELSGRDESRNEPGVERTDIPDGVPKRHSGLRA
jgi:hypothetical protein